MVQSIMRLLGVSNSRQTIYNLREFLKCTVRSVNGTLRNFKLAPTVYNIYSIVILD